MRPEQFQVHQVQIIFISKLSSNRIYLSTYKVRILNIWLILMAHLLRSIFILVLYLGKNCISDLGFWWKLTKISHHIRNLFFFDKVFLFIIKESKTFTDFCFQIFLSFVFLSHGRIVIPQHFWFTEKLYIIQSII